ncbi:MAG: ABC transporter ATP-binding protein [Chlamydiales bacterium]
MLATLMAMIVMTIASQIEILTIGILTQKSVSAFELFAPIENDQLKESSSISREAIEKRWNLLDKEHKGYITSLDAQEFLRGVKRHGLVDRVMSRVETILPLSNNIPNLALLIFIAGSLKAFSLFWHRYTTRLVAIRISRDLRQQYFEHMQLLPMSFYQKHDIGGLSARVVSDAFAVAEGINASLVNYLQTPFTVFSTMVLCFLLSWKLSMLIFLGIPAIIYPIIFLARKVRKVSRQLQKNQEHFTATLIDFLAGIQTVKIFSMENFSLRKYRDSNNRMAALEKKSARYGVSSRPIVHSIGMFFLATALIYGLYVLQMSVSELFVYGGFLMVFYEPIKKFAEENATIQRGIAAADRMFDVLSVKPDIEDRADAIPFNSFKNSIEFENVWFRYEDEWILKDLSFTINKGETVAIVGPTGAGKSTIVQLLPRLYDVQKGCIKIDGIPLQEYQQNSLRDALGFVPQKPFLFQDTVSENISFGRPFTQEQIIDAAKRAHAEEFILRLPQAYDYEIAENGKDLSGGQQQRLAIARALVKNAPILVMDEATSSLDVISENQIKKAIQELHGKTTQIIIAHRLTTIEDADKIIYLQNGQKLAEGTHQELMEICPPYRAMWDTVNKIKVSA